MALSRRPSLPRKAKDTSAIMGSHRPPVVLSPKAPKCNRFSEQDIDDKKHSRAMELLHRLQQRQEQISFSLSNAASAESPLPVLTDEMLDSELEAITEALNRLTRVFKLAKDELNDSQRFHVSAKVMQRKQIQINARLTKCAKLSRTQAELTEQYLEMKKHKSQNCVPVVTSGDSESSTDDSSVLFCEDATSEHNNFSQTDISIHKTAVRDLPFTQPLYSQPSADNLPPANNLSAAQSLLDDLFGSENDKAVSSFTHTAQPAQDKRQSSVIACCNGRIFASPPRPTIGEIHSISQHVNIPPNDINSDSNDCNSNIMDVTGLFEPSQKDSSLFQCDSDKYFDVLVGKSTAVGTLTGRSQTGMFSRMPSDTAHARLVDSEECQDVGSCNDRISEVESALFHCKEKISGRVLRRFVLPLDTKVELLSSSQLSCCPDDVWDKLPQQIIDGVDSWD